MNSVQALREFISARLNAAAGEIFNVFEQTVVQYEEEIVRQRKLLEISQKPQIQFHRADLQRHHDCRKEQLVRQETNYCQKKGEPELPRVKVEQEEPGLLQLNEDQVEPERPQIKEEPEEPGLLLFNEDQVEPERPQIKEEPEEPGLLPFSEDQVEPERPQIKEEPEEPLLLPFSEDQVEPERPQIKEEPEEPGLLPFSEDQVEPERPQIKEEPEEPGLLPFSEDQVEPQRPQIEEQEELCTSQEAERLILKVESGSFTVPSVEKRSDPEVVPDTEQFLSRDSEVHDVKKHIDSESTRNAELKRNSVFRSDRVDGVSVSGKQAENGTLLSEETVRKKQKLSPDLRTLSDKKLICEICGKSLARWREMFGHMRTHTGEKPYSCETCGKSFSQQNTLLRHMRTHTGEKPYSCETCGKSFNRQNNLLRHMRTHTGEKPYSCKTCGKCFSQHGSLRYHARTHQETKS